MENIPDFNKGKPAIQEFLVKEKPMKKYMVDASVVFKWYYKQKEEDIIQAEIIYALLKTKIYLLLAPELLIYEIMNIFRLKQEISIEKVNSIISELYETLIFISLEKELVEKAFKYSRELDISFYDSIYVALSEKYDLFLVSADRKLIDACRDTGSKILHISDFNRSRGTKI